MAEALNPYGDGQAAMRILTAIQQFFVPSQSVPGLEIQITPDSVTYTRFGV
jgi:hypothetical protein